MDENVWTFCFYNLTVLLRCNPHRKRCPKIPHRFEPRTAQCTDEYGGQLFEDSLHPYPRQNVSQLVSLTICGWLEFVNLDRDHTAQAEIKT